MNTRFLEEVPGVMSMARLTALLQTIGGFFVLVTSCGVAIRGGEHAAGIIAACAAGSAAAFAGAWAALKERGRTVRQQADGTWTKEYVAQPAGGTP